MIKLSSGAETSRDDHNLNCIILCLEIEVNMYLTSFLDFVTNEQMNVLCFYNAQCMSLSELSCPSLTCEYNARLFHIYPEQ